MQYKFIASAALLSAVANAANFDVTVGPDLKFHPSEIKAAKGDTVSFKINPDHNVQAGSFSSPCVSSGFSSGKSYQGSGVNPQSFRITLNDTKPIYGFCGEEEHCQEGMTFAINAPSSGDETYSAYNSAAGKAGSTKTNSNVVGGQYVRAGASSGSSSSSSSSGSASLSPTSSGSSTTGSASSATSAAASSSTSGGAAPGSYSQEGFATAAVMFVASVMSYFL